MDSIPNTHRIVITKWTRRSVTIGNILNNTIGDKFQEQELISELYELCDQEGVSQTFVDHKHQYGLLKLMDILDNKNQILSFKILIKLIQTSIQIRERLLNDSNFIVLLIENVVKLFYLKQTCIPKVYETCLVFLMNFFETGFNSYLSKQQEITLIQSITSSIIWNQNSTSNISLQALFSLFCHITTSEANTSAEEFTANNMKFLTQKWVLTLTDQKLGIYICQYLVKSLIDSQSDQIFCSIIEKHLDEILFKVLFEQHLTMNAEYYLQAILLFHQLLIHESLSVTQERDLKPQPVCIDSNHPFTPRHRQHIKQMINKYVSIIANVLVETIQRFKSINISICGLKIFHIILRISDELDSMLNESDQLAWISLLTELLNESVTNKNMDYEITSEFIEECCKVLIEIFTLKPKLIHYNVSEEIPCHSQLPLNKIIIQIMYTCASSSITSSAFCKICYLSSILASNSEIIQNKFLETNLYNAVRLTSNRLLTQQYTSPNSFPIFSNSFSSIIPHISKTKTNKQENYLEIYTATIVLLTSLVLFNNPAKEYVFTQEKQYGDAKSLLIQLQTHKILKHTPVFFRAIASNIILLTSLAEYGPFKYDLILGRDFNFLPYIQCEECSKNIDIIEALQELFIVLAGSETEREILLDIWSLESWLETSSKLINTYAIQKNTLIYFQLNVSYLNSEKFSKSILNEINLAIYRSLQMFPTSKILITEALVLIQLLVKQIVEFAAILVESDTNLDIFVFDIILEASSKDLINIAIHTFHVLTSNNNWKITMAKKAIKQNKLQLLHCLIMIGFDVTEVSSELLILAINQTPYSNGTNIVPLLLNHGCVPTKDIIKHCASVRNYDVMPLLLCYYGLYDSDAGTIIRWDSLNLKRIDFVLIVKLYHGVQEPECSDNLRRLSLRLKLESKNRIKLRKLCINNRLVENSLIRYNFMKSRSLFIDINGMKFQTKKIIQRNLETFESKDDEEFSSIYSIGEISKSAHPNYHNRSLMSIQNFQRTMVVDKVSKDNESIGPKATYSETQLDGNRKSRFTQEDYRYKPVSGELHEFIYLFRSGSNYSYNCMDPRCLLTKSSVNEMKDECALQYPAYFSSRLDLNNFVIFDKNVSFLENQLSLTRSVNFNHSESASNCRRVTQITELDLSDNQLQMLNVLFHPQPRSIIESVMESVTILTKMFNTLTELNLTRNHIKELPKSMFSRLPALNKCNLSNNLITDFPWNFFIYSQLKLLNIGKNKISILKIPDKELLDQLKEEKLCLLDRLILENNKMEEIDFETFKLFENLKLLNLKSTGLVITKNHNLALPQLKELDLSENDLSEMITEFLNGSYQIETLLLSQSNIKLNNGEFLEFNTFENLKTLDLRYNNLVCPKPFFIPKQILKIPNLKKLLMSNNSLLEFPSPQLWTSMKIEYLDFSHNYISRLDLTNAKINFPVINHLNISYNLIRQLPPEIGSLQELNYLNISFNKNLHSLPPEIGLLKKKLNSLVLDGLDLRDLPNHLKPNSRTNVPVSLTQLVKYYHNKLKHSVEYYSLKLMILGMKGRGKTSLMNSLQGQKNTAMFLNNHQEFGINVTTWTINSKNKSNQNVEYKLKCWDFVNQEEFFSSYEYFMPQRALYLLVFNANAKKENESDSLKPLLLALKSQAPLAPIIIVGTHIDKIPDEERFKRTKLLESYLNNKFIPGQFPRISKFVTVDARKPNKTINNLKFCIKDVLDRYEIRGEKLMGEKQPASIIKLEDCLMKECQRLHPEYPILTRRQMKVFSEKLEIDEDEFNQAIEFLNKCGVIVHFQELSYQLNNLYFLSPQWLCRMIARVINMKALNSYIHNGVIKLQDFQDLFIKQELQNTPKPFPQYVDIKEHALQCLLILEKFDVVFQRNEEEIIIPSKLQHSKPFYVIEEKTIRRVIEFLFLPSGFWSRLITRICALEKVLISQYDVLIKEISIWKKGLLIQFTEKHDDNKEQSTSPINYSLLLEGRSENGKEILDLVVSPSDISLRIFVVIIDNIEIFVEEWYPGLTDTNVRGEYLMRTFAICPECNETRFSMDEIFYEAYNSRLEINCLNCSIKKAKCNQIPLKLLAPDVVLGDLPDELRLKPELLEIETSSTHCLGIGGYGKVYRGRYKGELCAVKYFIMHSTSNDENKIPHSHCYSQQMQPDKVAYKQIRREIAILRLELNHLSLLALLAADPEKLVLEYAPLKDLTTVLEEHILSRQLLQRISFQVLDGLQFLHSKNVLYRDLKPQNILMFSIDLQAKVNSKLSDYGISRMMAPFGFVNIAGTHGYQAPEVIDRSMSYWTSSDIFSYGMTMFVMATRNHHPEEIRAHWRPGHHKELISNFNCKHWPRMQDLINKCLEFVPDDRPTSKMLMCHITSPSFITVESVFPLTQETRVQCCEALMNPVEGLELVMTNGNDFEQEIRCHNILKGTSKGRVFSKSSKINRVLSLRIDDGIALLGTQSGEVWVYKFHSDDKVNKIIKLPDSVLAIAIMKHMNILLIGLANGCLYYQVDYKEFQNLEFENFNEIKLGTSPITHIEMRKNSGYVTCGSCIFSLKYSSCKDLIEHEKVVEIDNDTDHNQLIKCLCIVENSYSLLNDESSNLITFIYSLRNEATIYHCDDSNNQLKSPIDCREIIRKNSEKIGESMQTKKNAYRIMSLAVWNSQRYLAAGTASGHIVILDQKLDHVCVLHLFNKPKIFLHHIKMKRNIQFHEDNLKIDDYPDFSLKTEEKSWLVAIGNGYKTIDNDGLNGATLVLLNDNVSKISRQLDEHLNSRK